MRFNVEISNQALLEIEQAFYWIYDRSPTGAARWYQHITRSILKLEQHPEQHPLAPESRYFMTPLKQMLVGNKSHGYRVLFTIHEKTVRVHCVRRGKQQELGSSDLPELN